MKNISIKRPEEDDTEQLLSFFSQTINHTYLIEGVAELLDDIRDEIECKMNYIKIDLESNGVERFFLLAKIDDKIVGSIALGPASDLIIESTDDKLKDQIEIGSVFVHPNYQGRGIGSLLMNSIFLVLMARNINKFCLDSGYTEAKKIWTKKFGEASYTLKDYWGKGNDHLIWSRDTKDFYPKYKY